MEIEESNFKGTFMRNLIVASQGALYEIITIQQLKKDGSKEDINLPFYYSLTGSEQFIKDYFLDTDRYCTDLRCKIEGVTNKIPRALITPSGNVNLRIQEMMGSRVRLKHHKQIDTEFDKEWREFNSRGEFLPIDFTFDAVVRCSNNGQMFKIFDAFIDSYIWKGRRFFMDFQGIRDIPCIIKFPDGFTLERALQMTYGDEKKPELKFNFEVKTYRPLIDKRTTFDNGNRIQDTTINIKTTETDSTETDAA